LEWEILVKFLEDQGEKLTKEEIEEFKRRYAKKQTTKDGEKLMVDATELIDTFV